MTPPKALLPIFLLAALGCGDQAQPPLPSPKNPVLGAGGIRTLAAGESHFYDLPLQAGEYVEIDAFQLSTDLIARIITPSGVTHEIDSLNGNFGSELLVFLAEESGTYRVEAQAAENQPPGQYEVRLLQRRPAAATERSWAAAAEHFRRGQKAFWQGDPKSAEQAWQAALALWESSNGPLLWRAETFDRLGRVAARQLDEPRAMGNHQRAADLFAAIRAPWGEVENLYLLARLQRRNGQIQLALQNFERALELSLEHQDRPHQGLVWNDLGIIQQDRGQIQEALELFERALGVWRELGDRHNEAAALHNLGRLARHYGSNARAQDYLMAAEEISRELKDSRNLAATLEILGQMAQDRGELAEARQALEEVLTLRGEGDSWPRGVILSSLGQVAQSEGDLPRARVLQEEALGIFTRRGIRSSMGRAWNNLAAIATADGRFKDARHAAEEALEIFRGLDQFEDLAEAHLQLANASRALGGRHEAREHMAAAVEIFETLRRSALSPRQRAFYFAKLQKRYDRYIDLLMELADEDRVWAVRAFEVHEQRRARTLLEALHRDHSIVTDPAQAARVSALGRELNAVDRLRSLASPKQSEVLERRLRQLSDELTEVQARSEARRSEAREDLIAKPLSLEEIRREVLDDETILLAFALGKERSFAWIVSTDKPLRVAVLPPSAVLEAQAETAYKAYARAPRREGRQLRRAAFCTLSHSLLQPIRHFLDDDFAGRRIAVVADGALERIPLAAMPQPLANASCSEEVLLQGREMVQLPSASMLAALRDREDRRAEPKGGLAIFADPVVGTEDPRLRNEGGDALERGRFFDRLPHTESEARAIFDIAQQRLPTSSLLLGFEATKARFLAVDIGSRDLLHVATHGVLDAEHPELSALVLSRLDPAGKSIDGLLYAHEIQSLDLEARLVVLSACETALGQELRGEGLLGLTRSFFQAGAARVLVSLWKVDDAATAELMQHFYRYLLIDAKSPAAALRAAQLEMLESSRYHDPYFWASFVVQGDWRQTEHTRRTP